MNAQKRRAIFARFKAANPHPTTELVYHSPFELLVAVILSAQATDKSVNAATAKLFRRANTPQAIAALGVAGLKPYIKTIGLYNNKATNIVATARARVTKHGGEIPGSREALEALP
ncbi:MAG: endonuclease III, partial [Gammaproteobacteria bacterium]